MKLKEIIDSQVGLQELLKTKLPIKISYKIAKLVKNMQPDLDIYNEKRAELVRELGYQPDKEKDEWKFKPDNLVKFNQEHAKLQDIELELGFGAGKAVEKIKVEELGDINIEPQNLVALGWLLED